MNYQQKIFFGIALLLLMQPQQLSAQKAAKAVPITVQYLSADNVYLNAGKLEGLTIGDSLFVMRGKQNIATLQVRFVSNHSSSCTVIAGSNILRKGDTVFPANPVVQPKAAPEETAPETASNRLAPIQAPREQASPPVPGRRRIERARISGSFSSQYYRYEDNRVNGLDFSQPTVRFNLRGRNLFGSDYNLRIRTRTRYFDRVRSLADNTPQTEWENRLYEASFSYDSPEALLNYSVGRILSNHLSGVGYIDGAQLQLRPVQPLTFGVFGGTQPDPLADSWGTQIKKAGSFVSFEKGDFLARRFQMTLAGAGEYRNGVISREFLYLQTTYSAGNRFYFFQGAEVDINRKWREKRAGESVSLSSIYMTARIQPNDIIGFTLQYDNRQNYWSYVVRSLEEELFDDALRQGFRGIVTLRLPARIRLSLNGGVRTSGDKEDEAFSGASNLYFPAFLHRRVSLSLNSAFFNNAFNRGINGTSRLAFTVANNQRFELVYGIYSYKLDSLPGQRDNKWAGINTNLMFLRHLYLQAQFELDWGADRDGRRYLAELGYRL